MCECERMDEWLSLFCVVIDWCVWHFCACYLKFFECVHLMVAVYRVLAAGVMAPDALVCVSLHLSFEEAVPHNSRHALGIRVAHNAAVLVVGDDKRLPFFVTCEL